MIPPGLILALGVLSLADDPDPAVARVQAELDRCGVSTVRGSIAYDDLIQGYVAKVVGSGTTDRALECFAASDLALAVDLDFEDAGQRDFYQNAVQRRPDMVAALASLRDANEAWLAARGLLAGLPQYREGDSVGAYAEALERHYAAEPGTLFEVVDGRSISLRPDVTPDAVRYFMALADVIQPAGGTSRLILVGEDGS